MKKFLLLIIAVFPGMLYAQAQHAFSVSEFNRRLGKIDTLCDKVYAVNTVNDSLTILAMGGYPPHQKFNIVAKGYKVNMDFSTIKGKRVCVIGTFVTYKRRPQITATHSDQLVIDTLPRPDQ